MQTYVIQLDTIRNLTDYVYLLENFAFDGIIRVNCTYVEPEDLLMLFECTSFKNVVLEVHGGTSEELDKIGNYLREKKLR